MEKFVFNIFKCIAISMIMVFVIDMGMYLWKSLTLDTKMKSIMTSMQQTVAESNGLTEESYHTYVALMKELARELNGDTPLSFVGRSGGSGEAMFINWGTDAVQIDNNTINALSVSKDHTLSGGGSVTHGIVKPHKDMREIGQYGDIMIVQTAVCVQQPMWRFIGSTRGSQNFQNDRSSGSLRANEKNFVYTYFVPCMNYSKVTK